MGKQGAERQLCGCRKRRGLHPCPPHTAPTCACRDCAGGPSLVPEDGEGTSGLPPRVRQPRAHPHPQTGSHPELIPRGAADPRLARTRCPGCRHRQGGRRPTWRAARPCPQSGLGCTNPAMCQDRRPEESPLRGLGPLDLCSPPSSSGYQPQLPWEVIFGTGGRSGNLTDASSKGSRWTPRGAPSCRRLRSEPGHAHNHAEQNPFSHPKQPGKICPRNTLRLLSICLGHNVLET